MFNTSVPPLPFTVASSAVIAVVNVKVSFLLEPVSDVPATPPRTSYVVAIAVPDAAKNTVETSGVDGCRVRVKSG